MTATKLISLFKALDLPETIQNKNCYIFPHLIVFCLVCTRFFTAGDMYKLTLKYNHSQSSIFKSAYYTIIFLEKHWRPLFKFNHTHLLSKENLILYARCIHAASTPLSTVWKFLIAQSNRFLGLP